MKILYVGDVMAKPGREVVKQVLPGLKKELSADFVIVQAENSDDEGKGPGKAEITALQKPGGDFFTGGNHSLRGRGSEALYADEAAPVIRPANLLGDAVGKGWQIVETGQGKLLLASILGQTVGRQTVLTSNPLEAIDKIIEETASEDLIGTIVNFHGDFSSEKVVFGHYLDGRVSAVVGDHWHIPTADARILHKGTAHITDVGMCGTLDSSLGVKKEIIIGRWKTNIPSVNEIEETGPRQFNAVLITIDVKTGLAAKIEPVRRIVPVANQL